MRQLSQNVPNLSPNAFAKVGDEGTRDVECLVENLRALLILADLTHTGSRKFRFSSQEPTCPNQSQPPTSSPKQLKRPSPNLPLPSNKGWRGPIPSGKGCCRMRDSQPTVGEGGAIGLTLK